MEKINKSLLDDESYREQFRALIDRFCFSNMPLSLFALFGSRVRKILRLLRYPSSSLITANSRRSSGDLSAKSEIVDLEVSIRALIASESEGAKIRSCAKWLGEGEVPTTFFFRSATKKFEKSFVHSVFSAHVTEVSSLPKVIRTHKHFYSTLVAEEPVDSTVRDNLLPFVTHCLLDVDQEICEGVLLLDQATEALILSNRNKTPGPDRLSVEFYLAFSSPSSKDFQ